LAARERIILNVTTLEAMEYLINLGHKKIAMISSENKYILPKLRLDTYLDTLEKHHFVPQDDYVIFTSSDYSFKSGKHNRNTCQIHK
jgi:LacI family transcriptional regulator, repressor for deo operon, udp, cdd, tsx, nupC, and nupG